MSIITKLDEVLHPDKIKTRSQAGQTLTYLEGYQAEKNANSIFGYEWSKELLDQEKLFERSYKNNSGKDMIEVAYKATVRVHVSINGKTYFRDGTGAGNGQAGNMYSAYELAIKESETDAMKRALKSLGEQFGISLYDKSYRPEYAYEKGVNFSAELKESIDKLDSCVTTQDIRTVYKNYTGTYRREFEKSCMERKKQIENT